MANNVVLKTIELTGEYQPLSAETLVVTVTVSCPPTNSSPATLRTPDGAEVNLLPGEWHVLRRVNLAELQVKGTPASEDAVTLVGGSW